MNLITPSASRTANSSPEESDQCFEEMRVGRGSLWCLRALGQGQSVTDVNFDHGSFPPVQALPSRQEFTP